MRNFDVAEYDSDVVRMATKGYPMRDEDKLDIVSAIWILACNDENPIITYEGIRYRLGLRNDFNVKHLVQARGEMFRRGIPAPLLQSWKEDMLAGKHLPSWI